MILRGLAALFAILSVAAVAAPAAAIAGQPGPAAFEGHASDGDEILPPGTEVEARIFHRWAAALRQHRAAVLGAERLCAEPAMRPCVFWAWTDFLLGLKGAPPERQLDEVNGYVNRGRYVGDRANSGEPDHWADPAEFFATGGDCEDFAIAKYFSLRALGFGPEHLRIVVVHDRERHQAHTVLVVTLSNRSFLLDTLYPTVVPWRAATHYRPLYSVNERAAWLHAPPPLT